MREMKDSGVQWIGEIPKTWSVSKVGMFYEVVLGKMLQSEKNAKTDIYADYLCAANVGNNTLKLDSLKQMLQAAPLSKSRSRIYIFKMRSIELDQKTAAYLNI